MPTRRRCRGNKLAPRYHRPANSSPVLTYLQRLENLRVAKAVKQLMKEGKTNVQAKQIVGAPRKMYDLPYEQTVGKNALQLAKELGL